MVEEDTSLLFKEQSQKRVTNGFLELLRDISRGP